MKICRYGPSLAVLAAGAAVALVLAYAPTVQAQQSAKPDPAAEPDWQAAAGGKMSFEVASVKSTTEFHPPAYPLDNRNAYVAGSRFSASFPVWTYISFAYKLAQYGELRRAALAHAPSWVAEERFAIDARVEGRHTKDQIRLMVQSLLAERFQLAVHFETRELPAFAVTLVKPGVFGPKLRPHSEGPPCAGYTDARSASAEVFPPNCETVQLMVRDGITRFGSRNSSMASLAEAISSYATMAQEVDKPIVDGTGLAGNFDFAIEYTGGPLVRPPAAGGDGMASEPQGTFLNAVRTQLGLKLLSTKASLRLLVIDHIEKPSEN